MLPHDFSGRNGPKKLQPDVVKVREPKEESNLPPTESKSYGETDPQQQTTQQ